MSMLVPPRPGDSIRAQWAQSLTRAINDNTRRLQQIEADWATMYDASKGMQSAFVSSAASPPAVEYTETSRTVTGQTITDSNGDTFTVNTVVQVVLAATSGQELTLNFASPT